MSVQYFDRDGSPMTLTEWAQSYETQRDKKRVAETTLNDGRLVSTVWLGIDHGFGSGPPVIFETIVFSSRAEMNELDCDRYSTEAEALAGHAAMCAKWAVEAPDPADA